MVNRWGSDRVGIALLIATALAGGLAAAEAPRGWRASVAAASDDSAVTVTVSPEAPVQGDTLSVIVTGPRSMAVTARFDGTAVAAYSLPSGARRALIGTDPTVATGPHRLVVTMTQRGKSALQIPRVVRLGSGRFGVRTVTLGPKTAGLITAENAATEWRILSAVLGRRTVEVLWSGPFVAPSEGIMDSPYGDQSFYNGRRAWWHQGMDYAASAGDPVVAANAGIVALAQSLPLGGTTVVIDHGQGVLTEYLHLSAFTVRVGTHVDKGALVGKIGATGLVTGPSLHWGLYVNGTWVNPSFWMEPRPGVTQ